MGERLDSWKAIAAYLGREVRTVERWANTRGLPVHRLPGGDRPRVFALKAEIDAWLGASGAEGRGPEAPERAPAPRHAVSEGLASPAPLATSTASARRRMLRTALLGVVAVLVLAGAAAVGRWLRPGAAGPQLPRTAIAVLPLENLSPQGAYAYFASGLHEELLTQLAKVSGLTVVGRTSVMAYAGTVKPLHEIAHELGVGNIVEGSVQVVGNQLRVNVQLLDAASGRHLWAERYDRTLGDAFAIESDIAQRIVAATGLTLGTGEWAAIAAPPTVRADAYDLYLQALDYLRRAGNERADLEAGQQLLERALALDSSFALAHASLATVHWHMYWFRYDPSAARAERARQEAETALRLAPSLPAAHLAMGAYYGGVRGDYRRALAECNIAARAAPNDARVQAALATIHRHLGDWDGALAAFGRAARLDPRNAGLFFDQGGLTLRLLRRYGDAIAAYRRALALAPDLLAARLAIGWAYAAWTGQLDTLRAVWAGMDAQGRVRAGDLNLLLLERKPDSLLALLAAAHLAWYEDQPFYRPTALYAAWAHALRGDTAAARASFQSALGLLDSLLRVLPDDWRVHAARGLALAGLERRADARREAAWLEQSRLYRRDRSFGPLLEEERAAMLARTEPPDAAIQALERLLAEPSQLSVSLLRLDPRWDAVRNDPRFQALLARYTNLQKP